MRNDWIRLPMNLLRRSLKPIDVIIAALLYDMASFDENNIIVVRLSQKYIADTLSISLDTVKRSIRTLSEYGIITEQIRTGKASYYFLADDVLPPKKRK